MATDQSLDDHSESTQLCKQRVETLLKCLEGKERELAEAYEVLCFYYVLDLKNFQISMLYCHLSSVVTHVFLFSNNTKFCYSYLLSHVTSLTDISEHSSNS